MTLSSGRCALAAAAGAVAALVLAAAPSAHAADDCPNALVRAAQNGASLPECRAYEQVSAPFKNGNAIGSRLPAVSPGGGLLSYTSNTAFGDALANVASINVARRGAGGWDSTSVVPPFTGRVPTLGNIPSLVAITPAFDSAILTTSYPLSSDDRGSAFPALETTNEDLYQYDADGSLTWLTRPPVLPDLSRLGVDFILATDDASRVVVRTQRALDPAQPGVTTLQYYLVADRRQAHLVSALPDGTPSAGVNGGSLPRVWGDERFSRIVFHSADDRLYLRDRADDRAAAQTRELTFGPARAICSLPNVSRFTADGERLLLTCRGAAHPDPAESTQSLYVADVDSGETTRLPVAGEVAAASDDLSRIYVWSRARALPGAQDMTLYLVRDGELSLVVTYAGAEPFPSIDPVVTSADGDQIAFTTRLPIGFPSGGFEQVYRYDADTGTLACVSCRPDGSPSGGKGSTATVNTRTAVAGALSADGRRLFFASDDRLLPGDTNAATDVYLWLDGALHLISTGRSAVPSLLAGASADGDEVYFTTAESLVPQDVDTGVIDLYAATVGGGFAAPAGTVSCTTDCQGPARDLEQLQTPGTVSFAGPGDVDDAAQPTVVKVFSVGAIGTRARAAWARGARAAIRVRLSHAGTASASIRARIGRGSVVVARTTRKARAGGTVSLPLRLSRRAQRVLRRQGELRTTVRVTVPGAGGAQSASFVLRTAKAKRGRR